jgi:glutamate-1-semialdehyde aminotransferase
MALDQAKTLADVRRVIAEAIRQGSNNAVPAEDASRCADSVVARLKESGVRLVKKRAA